MRRIGSLLFAATGLAASVASAHGLNGHTIVTDGSIDHMREEAMLSLLDDSSVLEAFRSGPIFPDSGYNPLVQRYGEAPHWEPFVEAQIRYIQENFAPPYDLEARKIIAFNLGSISHGMEDEIFDSLIDLNAREKGDYGEIDTGIDVFTVLDGLDRVIPELYFPSEVMDEIYNDLYGDDVPVEEMIHGMETTHLLVFEMFADMAPGMNGSNDFVGTMPWLHANYMDPRTPSSYPHEMRVVGPYLDAVWKRIENRFTQDDLILGSVPETGDRLISIDPETIDSWITVYFGVGVSDPTLNGDRIKLFDAEGSEVPATIGHTRWSNGQGISRLARVMPNVALEPNASYEVRIAPGLEFISGETTDRAYVVSFQTACADYCDPACRNTNVGAICGDGVLECDEACDDGDRDDCTDACNADCSGPAQPPVCGNGEVECGEACDDGLPGPNEGDCDERCEAFYPQPPSPSDDDDDDENEEDGGSGSSCRVVASKAADPTVPAMGFLLALGWALRRWGRRSSVS